MPAGRPTKMTESTLGKLEQAFALDSTVEQACFYADINPDTYYEYVKNHPEYSERIKALRNRPVLAALQKVVGDLTTDIKNAQWYLERKSPDFRPKSEVTNTVLDETRDKLKEFFDDLDDNAYKSDDASAEPVATDGAEPDSELPQAATDLS
jgi:hypothetical protein